MDLAACCVQQAPICVHDRPIARRILEQAMRCADSTGMRLRSIIGPLAGVAAVALPAVGQASPTGTREQVAWVRRAATNFVDAELRGDGAGACSILNAPLRATRDHRTCAQRWDARLTQTAREPGGRARLRAEARAIPSAVVLVHGDKASIRLPFPLMSAANRFVWSENCWMLEG